MACALTQGISALECRNNAGGVSTVYLTEFANVETYTLTAGVLTSITMAVGTQFWQYSQLKETSDFKEDFKISATKGTIGYEQTVSLFIPKRDTEKRNELYLLAQNTIMVIVKDLNGYYKMIGLERGADLNDGSTYNTGKAVSDDNAWSLNLMAKEGIPAPEVDATLIADLIIPAV